MRTCWDGLSWPTTRERPDLAEQREILGELIGHVEPQRVEHGRCDVRITWTPLGEALHRAVQANDRAA